MATRYAFKKKKQQQQLKAQRGEMSTIRLKDKDRMH
jgi:hypothetical protein